MKPLFSQKSVGGGVAGRGGSAAEAGPAKIAQIDRTATATIRFISGFPLSP
jgi:hypothetical protein